MNVERFGFFYHFSSSTLLVLHFTSALTDSHTQTHSHTAGSANLLRRRWSSLWVRVFSQGLFTAVEAMDQTLFIKIKA